MINLSAINKAMLEPDSFVVQLDYRDSKGVVSRRVVSPIRMIERKAVLALCLCREEPRRFELERISNVKLVPADDVLMPVAIEELKS